MSATATAKASEPAAGAWVDICQEPGAALDVNECLFRDEQANASLHLLMLCGEVAGRLTPSGGSGYAVAGNAESGWLRLGDVDAAAVAALVRRVQRAHPGFELDAPVEARTIHDKLSVHFGRAQRRWKQAR